MSIYSADDEDDNDNVDNGVRRGGHGPVMKQDDDVGHGVTKQDDGVGHGVTKQDDGVGHMVTKQDGDVGNGVMKQDVASEHQSGSNNSEDEEQIIIVRCSKRLQDVRDMKSFIVDDYTQKRKSYKARRERCRMAAPFILDKASVSLRPTKGYYGNFGKNDNEYVDHDDFSSENGNKNATDISIDDDDEMSLGDTMLCNNINKQIEFLHEDDIALDQFEKLLPVWTPKTCDKPKGRGRGRFKGARVPKGARHGRGCGTQMPKEEKEDNEVGGKNLTHNEMDNEKEPGIEGNISIK